MEKYIITIARGYGSGGKTIAQMLSKKLGIRYYDRDLIRMVSEESGINEALFNLADETHKPNPFKKYAGSKILPPDDDGFVSNDNLFNLQAETIRRLAHNEEPCIIVGRCAHHILKDEPHVIRVFIHADMEHCIKNVMERNGVDADEARSLIIKTDKERAHYHKYFANMEWNDARNYDLCLNTSKLSFEQCVQTIIDFLKVVNL